MKTLLPASTKLSVNKSSKGFTLMELLVVISIIAIMAAIGFTVFNNAQRNARDARRRSEVDSIAKALEIKKVPNATTYSVLAPTDFVNGVIPVDTTTAKYCVAESTTSTVPGAPTTWATTDACPTEPTGYNAVSGSAPAATAVSWRVCTLLENGTGAPPSYCKSSAQ